MATEKGKRKKKRECIYVAVIVWRFYTCSQANNRTEDDAEESASNEKPSNIQTPQRQRFK